MTELHITLITEDINRLLRLKYRDGEADADIFNMSIQDYAKKLLTDTIRAKMPEMPASTEEVDEITETIAQSLFDAERKERQNAEELAERIAEAIRADLPSTEKIRDTIRAEIRADINSAFNDIVITDTMPDEI